MAPGGAYPTPDWFKPILAEYDRRRRLWMETLDSIGVPYTQPQGAYYVFIDIRATGLSSAEFVSRAREEAGWYSNRARLRWRG